MFIPEATQENKTTYTNKGLGEQGGGGNLWFRIPALAGMNAVGGTRRPGKLSFQSEQSRGPMPQGSLQVRGK